MAMAAKRKRVEDGEEPPLPQPRKLEASVVPIAAGIKTALRPTPVPVEKAKVTALHVIPKKNRFDFEDDLTYQLYLQFQRLQAEEEQAKLAFMQEMKDNVGTVEELPTRDLLPPAAGAVPVTRDESERLAAYLAHHNPIGATKIKTVEGNIVLSDGTVLRVPMRQDMIEPGVDYEPYGGRNHGQVFWLSDSRTKDIRRAKKATRNSQRGREALGKTERTAYENVVKIHTYRPVPDVMWFLRNPDGKSHFYGDLNPYPPGIVPVGNDEAAYHADKKAHSHKVAAWLNSLQGLDTGADDLPWDYAEPEEVSTQVSEPQRAESTSESPVEKVSTTLKIVYKDGTVWLHPSMEPKAEPQGEPTFHAPVPVGPVETVLPTQPEAGITIAQGEHGQRLSLDPRDRRAIPAIKLLLRRMYADLDDILDHIDVLEAALHQAETYRRTGEFDPDIGAKAPGHIGDEVDLALDAANADLFIEPVPYEQPEPASAEYKRGPLPSAGFRSMIQHAEYIKWSEAGRLRQWNEADELRIQHEARALHRYESTKRSRVMREVEMLRQVGYNLRTQRQLRAQEEHRQYLINQAWRIQLKARAQAALPEELKFYRAMGTHNWAFRGQIERAYKRGRLFRRLKGKFRRFTNLGTFKPKRQPPSTVSESPVNEFVPLPARAEVVYGPKPKPEPIVLLPETKVLTFSDDPVIASVRRAHFARLAKSGKFTKDELEQADKVFTMVA